MKSFRKKPVGWATDNHRHYLAAKFGSAKRYFTSNWDLITTKEGDKKFVYPGPTKDEVSPTVQRLMSLGIRPTEKGQGLIIAIPRRNADGTYVKDADDRPITDKSKILPEHEAYGLIEQELVRRDRNRDMAKGEYTPTKEDAEPYWKSLSSQKAQKTQKAQKVEKAAPKAKPKAVKVDLKVTRELARGLL